MNAIKSVPAPILWILGAYCLAGLVCAFGVQSFCQDEGFYALAAKGVTQGMRPYRDFLYPQMPFLPYVYAAWFRIFGVSIEAGRALSVVLSVVGTGFMMASSRRLAGDAAAVVAGLIMLASCYTCADLARSRPRRYAMLSQVPQSMRWCAERKLQGFRATPWRWC